MNCWLRLVALLLMLHVQHSAFNSVYAQEAFYIYQNDGHFDGFFYDEVEKITYSCLDTLGIEHNDYVSQEIVTADSTYRIMLSAIDSVGFVQPKMEFRPNVHNIREEGMIDYISYHDENNQQIMFYGDTPSDKLPRVGDVLVDFDLDNGFSGKVTNVENIEGFLNIVYYEPIESLHDVFLRFVSVEQIDKDKEGRTVRRRVAGAPELNEGDWWQPSQQPKRASDVFEGNVFKFGISGHLPIYISDEFSATLDANLSVALSIKGSYNIPVIGAYYIGLTFQQDVTMGLGVTLDGKLDEMKERQTPFAASVPIPAAAPIFELRSVPGLFLRGEAHLKFSADLVKRARRVWFKLEFKDDWLPTFNLGNEQLPELDQAFSNVPDCDASLEFNGFIQAGLHAPLELGVNRWLSKLIDASFGTHVYLGPKLSGAINFSLSNVINDKFSFYNLYKESNLSLTPLSLDYETKAELKTFFSGKKEVTIADGSVEMISPISLYFVPNFELQASVQPQTDVDFYGDITAKLKPSRNVLFPLEVGVGLYKKNDVPLGYYYSTNVRDDNGNQLYPAYSQFSKQWEANPVFEHTFVGLYPGNYVVRPCIKVMGVDFPASPAVDVHVPGVFVELMQDTIYTNCDEQWVSVQCKAEYDSVHVTCSTDYVLDYEVPASANGGEITMRFKVSPNYYFNESGLSYIDIQGWKNNRSASDNLWVCQSPNDHILPQKLSVHISGICDGNDIGQMVSYDGNDFTATFNGESLHIAVNESNSHTTEYEGETLHYSNSSHCEFDIDFTPYLPGTDDWSRQDEEGFNPNWRPNYTLSNGQFSHSYSGETYSRKEDQVYSYGGNSSGTFGNIWMSTDISPKGVTVESKEDLEGGRTLSFSASSYNNSPNTQNWSGSSDQLSVYVKLYFNPD